MIDVRNLSKEFNGNKVLRGVTLTVKKGETLAVIGPSGCGKSTLLRLILGLIPPTSGIILVDGKNIAQLKGDEINRYRQRFGMVFQSSALFDSLSVGENISFGLREHQHLSEKEIQKIIAEKLEMVGLRGEKDLFPSELSGGMQKRVSLARALATNPEIMLYDEPTTGLDPIMSTSIEDLILKIHRALNVTAIVVTHQLSTVYRIANRINMLHEGRIIEAGTSEETKSSSNPIIRQFVEGKTTL